MSVAFDRRKFHDVKESVTRKDGNVTEPDPDAKQGTEDAPGEEPLSVVAAHGAATDIHIKHDSAGTHVETTHPDGYTHKQTHLDKERGHMASRQMAGLDEKPDDQQQTEDTRARAHPIGPKEKERLDREGGIRIPGDSA